MVIVIRDLCIAFGYEINKQSEKKANESVDRLKSYASKALGAIGIGFSLVKLNAIAEEFNGINDKIRNATRSMGEQADIQQRILRQAQEARVSYKSMADAVSSMVEPSNDVFKSVEEASEFATVATKLFKNYARSESEISSLLQTMSKAMAKGVVDSRMLNVFYQAPEALSVLSKHLGVTSDKVQGLVASGKVSAQALRDAFLAAGPDIEKNFEELDYHVSDAILNIRNQFGLWVDSMKTTLGVNQKLGRTMVRGFNVIMGGLRKAQAWIERFSKAAGGAGNMLRLLAIAGGSVFAALNAGKILSFVKNLTGLLNPLHLKVLAIAAVIALIALAVDDLVNFMRGNNSVIGEIFKRMGADAGAARAAVINAWNAIKTNLEKIWLNLQETAGAAWGAIKAAAEAAFGALKAFWAAWGDEIKAVFEMLWEALGQSFQNATDAIIGILDLFTAIFSGDWKGAWDAVKDIAAAAWDEIVLVFTTAKDAIISAFERLCDELGPLAIALGVITSAAIGYKLAVMAAAAQQAVMAAAASGLTAVQIAQAAATKAATVAQWLLNAALTANPIGLVIALIAGLVAAFVLLWKKNEGFRNFFISMWEGLKNFFAAVAESLKSKFAAVVEFFKAIWSGVSGFFNGIWGVLAAIVTAYIAIWKAVFTGVIDFFKSIWGGASGFFSDIWDGLVDKVKGAADKIKNFLQPILDIIGGVKDAIGGVTDKVKGAVGGAVDKARGVLGFAKGTERTPDTFVAGEEGPELITGARGRKVFTASETDGLVGAIGSAVRAILSSVAVAREALSKMPAPSSEGGRAGNAAIADAIRAFGSDILSLAKSAAASPQTAQSMISQTAGRSITQNVSFTNTFNGERAIQKRSAESMNRSVKDVTGQLAAALAYTR